MNRLKNLSVYRPLFLVLLSFYLSNWIVTGLCLLILLISSRKELILYIVLLIILFTVNYFKYDFISYGIVDYKSGNYYICDKLLYKVKIKCEDLYPGDIVYFSEKGELNNVDSQICKNILYICNEYKVISSFKIRSIIYKRINSFNDSIKTVLNKVFYNLNDYNNSLYDLGYGLMSYYFFSFVLRKNRLIGIIGLTIYSLIFCFETKFFLILIRVLLNKSELDGLDKYLITVYLLVLINPSFLNNYSLLIPLIIRLYRLINIKLHYSVFMAIMNIVMFNEINPIYTFLYPILIYVQIFIFGLSLIYLLIPAFDGLYLTVIELFSFLIKLGFSIRGKLTVFSLLLLYFLFKKIHNNLLKYLLIVLLSLSPINNPFFHITYIDVGQGNATLIRNQLNGKNVLIDTGSTYNYLKLKKYLYSESIYVIDKLIITHDDSDHNGNIGNLKDDFTVLEIVSKPIDVDIDNIHLHNYFLGDYENDNDNSLIYSLNADGYNFLFTGDISTKVEGDFIDDYSSFKCDFFLASHHGSNTGNSDYFIRNIMPRYTIISTSGMYNHPSIDTLNTLDKYKVKYYITKECGNIRIDLTRYLDLISLSKKGFVIISKK